MTPERWQDVERIYHGALERPLGERAAFLDDSCQGDEALQSEVQSLLDESSSDTDFLEQPLLAAAHARQAPHPSRELLGHRLSEYELTAWIGAGGMGEVYRARDVKLGRDVAIKVLPARLADDIERVSRFRREAQILARLNHPHIASIYALEESDGVLGLVLEFVDGPTLAERIAYGALPLNETLTIASQIGAALETAHAKGIVHRDLKPANVKVSPDGVVKVLDFGLAKAVAANAHHVSQLATVDATHDGVVLGTAPYMSPEQARGLPVDTRTDIWAFGCVVYEALSGCKAFDGDTATDCLAAIVGKEPDWTKLPPSTPARVVDVLKECLTKNVKQRLAEIGDARRAFDEVRTQDGRRHEPVTRPATGTGVRRSPLVYVALFASIAAAGFVGFRAVRGLPITPERVDVALDNGEYIAPTHSSELALSNDGALIAYASTRRMVSMPSMSSSDITDNSVQAGDMGAMSSMGMVEQVYVRTVGQPSARAIGGALGSAPFFSPDGKWLGFWHTPSGTLRKVALTGGAPVKICDAVSGIAGATWGPNDSIVFAWFDLFRVPAAGGSPGVLLKVDEQRGERFFRHPSFLPSGKAILFTIGMADNYSYDDAEIGVVSLETGQKKILVQGGTSPRYSSSGHLIYAREGKLVAVPFDVNSLEITGQPFPVADGVFMSANTGMAAYAISGNGHLVYAAGPEERATRVAVWVDKNGQRSPLPLPPRSYLHPRLSPDGHELAIEVEGAAHDIFIYDLARGALSKMSFDGASHWPSWTPDGKRLTYRSWKTGTMTMWWMPADKSGPSERLTDIGSMQSPESWSPDGKVLAFTQMDDPQSGSDIYVLPMNSDRTPHELVRTKFSEGSPKFSPDGQWLAYSSNESGVPEVYVTAYPRPGPTIQLSTRGGTDPLWRGDGRELYYRNGDRMMAVTFDGGSLTVSKPRLLWTGNFLAGTGSSCGMTGPTAANYDVTPDGERFLMIEDTAPAAECALLRIVLNWSPTLSDRAMTSSSIRADAPVFGFALSSSRALLPY
jgi:Tol biopolymer transport system component